jgi:ribosomal protein S15P/S13E
MAGLVGGEGHRIEGAHYIQKHLSLHFQEAVEKYQQSKRELDEVVAQMESLVSCPTLRTEYYKQT